MAQKVDPDFRPKGNRPRQRFTGRSEAFGGQQSNALDDWIAIEPDGTVTAYSGKVELGTGTRTALAQIVAEELDVPFEQVQMVMGDTAETPNEGFTAGSMTVQQSGTALRQAAAEARRALLEMASDRLDATQDELVVDDGVISVKGDPRRRVTYANLVGGRPFNREVSGSAPQKDPRDYRVVGKPVPRADMPTLVSGAPRYVQDVTAPGMLHARLVRPPNISSRLVSIDVDSVKDIPGLVQVVQRGNFVGVVAEREEQAVKAAKQLKLEWETPATLPPMVDLYDYLRRVPASDDMVAQEGDIDAGFRQAKTVLHATYDHPYHAHAMIGPSCAVADVAPGEATIWSSTTGPYPLRGAIAGLLEMPEEAVRVIHVEASGGYGQSGADDVAADAAVLSQAVGRPVRLQWSREDEFVWEPKSPAMVMDVRGGLDGQGRVIAWDYQVWSPSHVGRAVFSEQLLTAQLIAGQPAGAARFSLGAERNARTNYAFPNQRVVLHGLESSPLRASAFRSLGGVENTFANESFMDELAVAASADPVEFRLRHLPDARNREVLQAVARLAGWEPRPAPAQRTGRGKIAEGRGVAFAQYENDQAVVACVAYVQVDTESGEVRVKRVVVAHDCGLVINPDGLKNQIEGNVIQSLSRALKEEVKFDERRITSVDWESYPILKFSEVPEIEIALIDRPEQPAVGAGEPSTVTTAAAVANAIFDATGARLRQIPFTPARVRAALGSMNYPGANH